MANSAITGSTLIDFPAGMIMPFAGSTVPNGWLECNGDEVDISAYPTLAAALGTVWNTAKNPLTGANHAAPAAGKFRVPDMRGAFLRGSSGGQPNQQGVTTGVAEFQGNKTAKNGLSASAVGSSVSGTIGGADGTHAHSISDPGHIHSYGSTTQTFATGGGDEWRPNQGSRWNTTGASTGVSVATTNSGHGHSSSLSAAAQTITVGAGDDETRPDAVGVRYLIKY